MLSYMENKRDIFIDFNTCVAYTGLKS